MALFRVTLDGNLLTDEPEGLMEFVSELKRDKAIRGQVLLVDLTLKFKGNTDGYAHLKPLIDCQGFCASSEIIIEESCNNDINWITIFDGLIFYTEVKEHLFPCILECQLTDNSYFAKIDNNKNIEAYVNVARSKNDVAINTEIITAQFFDVVTGTYTGVFVNVWAVWYCFRFIIDYMTDGEMDFASDYFYGNLISGDGRYMTITTGEQIRLGSGGSPTKVPFISFQKLFEEVNKKIRIAFSIETDAITGRKVMRIEPESYFFDNSLSTVTLNNVKGIVKSVNTSELYSRLKIGSTETIDYNAGQTDFPTNISFSGFIEESYTITGKCNIDNTLDLVSDWIIDSNVIQDVFTNGNTGYDDDIFFVMVDYLTDPFNEVAIQTDVFATGAPPYFYNDFLRNVNVAQRWLGGVPNSIALYLGPPGNDTFLASKTNTQSLTPVINSPAFEPVFFQDDFTPPNNDPGLNYVPLTSEYKIPANGLYTFSANLIGTTFRTAYTPPTVQFQILLRVYDNGGFAGGNLLDSIIMFDSTVITPALTTVPYNISGSATINGAFNNKILIALDIFPHQTGSVQVNATIDPTSTFSCTVSASGGGVFQTYNPEDFKAYQYDIKDYPLTFSEYQSLIADPLKLLPFNDGNNDYNGWIENMKYNHIKGTADFLLSKSLQKTACE